MRRRQCAKAPQDLSRLGVGLQRGVQLAPQAVRRADVPQQRGPLEGLQRAVPLPELAAAREGRRRAFQHVSAPDAEEQVADPAKEVGGLLVRHALFGDALLHEGLAAVHEASLQVRGDGAVEAVETRAVLDHLEDPRLVLEYGGLGLLNAKTAESLPHVVEGGALQQRPPEVLGLAHGQGDGDGAGLRAQGYRREHLEVAPHARGVLGPPPRSHQRHDLADVLDALPELPLEVVEGHDLALRRLLADSMLVYAKAADPDVGEPRLKVVVPAVRRKGICDLCDGVAPAIAQHEVRNSSVAPAVNGVDVSCTQLAVSRAPHSSALGQDHWLLDVVDRGIAGQTG
mmetsp:Transcript_3332/g.11096  ORF Transcript_3332/g.11096 Transcript_3332/m.11096 type:complete len:342 (-) Transcript_3332:108-1133(-)